MELRLEVPKKGNKKEIEKTYITEEYDLPFGVVANILETIDFNKTDELTLGLAILKNMKEIKPLMLDIFEGLTSEELDRVGTSKLVPIIFQIFVDTKEQLTAEIKNVMGEHK